MLSTHLLVALSKPSHPHQKHIHQTPWVVSPSPNAFRTTDQCGRNMLLVEVGRIELPSRTLFSLLHTAILTLYFIFIYKANLCLYSNLNFLNPAIQLSRFSINNRGKSLSTPMIIIKLPTGIPVRSSKATAYAAVCIK